MLAQSCISHYPGISTLTRFYTDFRQSVGRNPFHSLECSHSSWPWLLVRKRLYHTGHPKGCFYNCTPSWLGLPCLFWVSQLSSWLHSLSTIYPELFHPFSAQKDQWSQVQTACPHLCPPCLVTSRSSHLPSHFTTTFFLIKNVIS